MDKNHLCLDALIKELFKLAANNPNDYKLGKEVRKLLEELKKEED